MVRVPGKSKKRQECKNKFYLTVRPSTASLPQMANSFHPNTFKKGVIGALVVCYEGNVQGMTDAQIIRDVVDLIEKSVAEVTKSKKFCDKYSVTGFEAPLLNSGVMRRLGSVIIILDMSDPDDPSHLHKWANHLYSRLHPPPIHHKSVKALYHKLKGNFMCIFLLINKNCLTISPK